MSKDELEKSLSKFGKIEQIDIPTMTGKLSAYSCCK